VRKIMDLCYTVNMEKNHQIWREWTERLHGWGLANIVVSFLQLSKPFHYLGVQAIYVTKPFLSLIMTEKDISDYATLLEDENVLSELTNYLEDEIV
jgi:hypothetical protein